MSLDPSTIAAIRFGFGFHPKERPPASPNALLADLTTNPRASRLDYAGRAALLADFRAAGRANDEAARMAIQKQFRSLAEDDLRDVISAAVAGPGFTERLTHFWADHFTVAATSRILRLVVPDFFTSAIRPHVTGSFSDMLRAATFHPAMLVYLDQVNSVGPNSVLGLRRDRGLNENLAREVLELHTLGVDGPYGQDDVHELARLMTGLSVDRNGFRFRDRISEPGQMTILGKTYGRRRPGRDQVEQALEDIALHPATARHIADKLIVHFIGAPADSAWVEDIANAFLASDGDLPSTYRALLEDERAWSGPFAKAKTPFEFVISAFRAAGAEPDDVMNMKRRDLRRSVAGSMALMGQTLFRPSGPNGWPEHPEAWITPPGLAARIRWSAGFAEQILKDRDPRTFLDDALGEAASDVLRFAVAGSESRVEGCALTLASPEFNRR